MSRVRILPRNIFVDTGAYVGLANVRDSNHAEALVIQTRMASARQRAVTTNFIIAETHALLVKKTYPAQALRVIEKIVESASIVVRIEEVDEVRALEILTRYTDKDFSYTDATSFAVMERLGIGTAFTFDHHFGQYGFEALTADPG